MCLSVSTYFTSLLPGSTHEVRLLKNGDLLFDCSDDNIYFLKCLFFFKNHTFSGYDSLVDICAIHKPFTQSFELVYIFNSFILNSRILLLLKTKGIVFSIINFFKGANWAERECWDLFGIYFVNHSDLRRILTDYGFEGHPLRKDFPLTGFFELRYDEPAKSLLYEFVELSQELREFKFSNPWSKTL